MELTEIYEKGESALREREIGRLLDGVETGFVLSNDRRVLDRFTFRQQCIDGVEPNTDCDVLGVKPLMRVLMEYLSQTMGAIRSIISPTPFSLWIRSWIFIRLGMVF
jgi:hypothetical protein